jgi:Protein of unknown function (DUF2844)
MCSPFPRYGSGFLWVLAILASVLPSSIAAVAELGGDVSTIQADQVRMKGALRITRTSSYDVHEVQTSSGTTVREYVSPSGKVFAVSWEGPWLPNLQQLLGPYFADVTAAQNHRQSRGPLLIHQPNVVVQSSGHMRSFVGRAYIPDMLPPGVHPEDIQ